jgi:VWFA-related protein
MFATIRPLLVASFLFLMAVASLAQQQSSSSSESQAEQQSVKINTSEVLLDVLVKDKKGRPVRDLKPEEIEVFEDGVKQQITAFRLINIEEEKKGGSADQTTSASLRQLNLVTLVFDHFDAIRALSARDAGLNFVDNALNENMLIRVLVSGRKLYVVEQFTKDAKKIRQAIMKATAPTEKTFAEASERTVNQLKTIVGDGAATLNDQEMNVERVLARLTLDTLLQTEKSLREVKTSSSIFSLLHIARAQKTLPGRKIVVYFTNGFYLPLGLTDALRAAISESNRANVSFHVVDTQRVIAGAGNQSSRLESGEVRNATRRAPPAYFNARMSTFSIFEGIERKLDRGKEGTLAKLSEETGGFVIDDTVDFSGALRRAASELGNYYAISYVPSSQENDGKFRAVKVNIVRPGVKAQTRSGYFAVPPANSRPVLSYETPMLAALNSTVVPHDFDLHAAILHFGSDQQGTHHVAALEVPLANFVHSEDTLKKAYPISFSVLGMIKDEKGEIIERFSETHPAEIPSEQIEAVKKENFTLTRHFRLLPGQYTFETVAHDVLSGKFSAQRKAFTVTAPQQSLRSGSLFPVKRVEQVEDVAAEAGNPLVVRDKRIVPDLAESFSIRTKNDLSFHLAVFPAITKESGASKLRIELSRDGKVVAETNPELPRPDEKGRITFVAGIPSEGLLPGRYRLRAVVSHANETAEESATFTISSNDSELADGAGVSADEKVIAGSLSPSDSIGELTLSALEAAKPVELSIAELLEDAEKSGARMYRLLGDYTYSLRKVRRTLDPKGRIRDEEHQDYEAYPVKGRHALVQLGANGLRFAPERIEIDRKQATEILIKNEEEKSRPGDGASRNANAGYWVAGLAGFTRKNKYVYVTIDPAVFFRSCEFSSPRSGLLNGRENIILNFRPRAGSQIESDKEWVGRIEGNIWIDVADRSLVRIEGQSMAPATTTAIQPALNFVYQQQRLTEGLWSPHLVRINSAGDESLFGGLNWDAWFEFNNFKRFDSHDSDVKLIAPEMKRPNR